MPEQKQPSAAQLAAREKFAQAARERAKAKKGTTNEQAQPTQETAPSQAQTTAPGTVTLDEDKFNALMERLARLEETKTVTTSTPNTGNGFDSYGKPVGVIQRYSVDPANYADPRDKLANLPELQRVAFGYNYMLDWDIDQMIYETKFGTSFADPKFTLVLYRKMLDEDGNPTGKRILIQTGIFFEDPAASIKEAAALGLPIDNANSKEFLEQMRFLRYKQWLLDIFNPKTVTSTKKQVTHTVIDNKVVQVEDYSVVV